MCSPPRETLKSIKVDREPKSASSSQDSRKVVLVKTVQPNVRSTSTEDKYLFEHTRTTMYFVLQRLGTMPVFLLPSMALVADCQEVGPRPKSWMSCLCGGCSLSLSRSCLFSAQCSLVFSSSYVLIPVPLLPFDSCLCLFRYPRHALERKRRAAISTSTTFWF